MAARALASRRRLRRRGGESCKSPVAIALKVLYWLAVFAISLALLVGLVLFFESRDDSTLDEGARASETTATSLVLDSVDRRL